jgi:hypothetical protein
MRRILVLFSVPIMLSLGITTASVAAADTVNGGTLTDGTAVTRAITVPDREVSYTFPGTSGIHETLDITASNWGTGSAQLGVYLPNGVAALFCPLDADPTFCEFTPHVTGTWKVVLQPLNDAVGSVTFKLAADQVRGTLTPGTASTTTIAIKGQRAGYTFTGTKGVPAVIDVSASAWSGDGANLNIYQPDGVHAVICPIDSGPTTCEFTPPVTGLWRAEIAPSDDALGSATIMLVADPNQGALTPGTAVTTTIKTRATTATYTFAATKSVRTLISVTKTDWGNGSADLNIYQPDGVHSVNCPIEKTAVVCDFTPPVSGTWKAEIAPDDDARGSVTMTLATDQNKGLMAPGVATTTNIAVRGQRAFSTFPALNGDKQVINVTGSSWGDDGADLNIYLPNGVLAVICPLDAARVSCAFRPRVSGTWKAEIMPADDGVGSATMTLVANQAKGTLLTGNATTTVIATKGTTASYTFAGTKNVRQVLDVSDTDWGGGSAELKLYLPDGDLGLSCPIKSTSTLCHFIPKVTGTWKVMIDPIADAVGTVTMTLGADQNKGMLVPGVPVITTFGSRGWQATYTFAATAKLHATIDVTATDWGKGDADLLVFQPNGVLAMICPLASAPTFCDFIPKVSGIWKVAVVPGSDSIGSAKMTLAMDQNKGALTAGTAVTTTITTKGQRAYSTFAGTAGKSATIAVSSTNWGSGSANLNIYQPNGSRVMICPISTAAATCTFSLRSTGTWKVEVAPNGNALGSATFKLN